LTTDLAEAAFEITVRYPQTEAAYSEHRDVQAAVWAGRIWGLDEGWACIGLGHAGHVPPNGKYQFTRMEHRFYHWPSEVDRFLTEAIAAAEQADVYIIPVLRVTRSARKGDALPGRVAWADVDGAWTTEHAAAATKLGAWQVASGSGGRHIYLQLNRHAPPDRLEAWNRRLGVQFHADAKWAENALLRLPGTLNHKPRAAGGQSVPVRWVQ
jgi:putative DNA primase/helicase